VGERRKAFWVVVSFVATGAQVALLVAAAYLPFAWWERVNADGVEENPSCTDRFPVGQLIVPAPSDIRERKPCLNEAGDVAVFDTKQYDCENGSVLFANHYGWWSAEDEIVKVPTDRGTPPRAVLDDCLGR
jgi:hypothetical protein